MTSLWTSYVISLALATCLASVTSVGAVPQPGDRDRMRAVGFRDESDTRQSTATVSIVATTIPSTSTTSLSSADDSHGEEIVEEEEEEMEHTTRKPYNCSESHRPHRNDSNKFQVRHNNVWWDQVCQTGLVWNQSLCRCEYPKDGYPNEAGWECPDYKPQGEAPGKYLQRVNGVWLTRDCNLAVAGLVWNQTTCRCEWGPEGDKGLLNFDRNTPCDTMLNVTFENGLVDDAKSSFLDLASGSPVSIRHYRARDGQPNKAAYFQDSVLNVWYFAGNEMSGSLRVEFRFKAEDTPETRDRYQILLSNGCNVTGVGYTTPSLAIGYRASDKSFLLALHTANVRKAIVCTRDLEAFSWHLVSLIYEDGTLLFRVDNHPCIISNDFTGEVEKTSCPLTIGADPLEKESKYVGYMDDLMVARYCRRFVEQTFVPEEEEERAKEVGGGGRQHSIDPQGKGSMTMEERQEGSSSKKSRSTSKMITDNTYPADPADTNANKIQTFRAIL